MSQVVSMQLCVCPIAVITVFSGLTSKRGKRVNSALYWPNRLICMPFKTKCMLDCRLNCNNSYYRYPITTFGNWIPAIGHPQDLRFHCTRFKGLVIWATFLFNLSCNIVAVQVETLCCTYYHLRGQLISQQNTMLQVEATCCEKYKDLEIEIEKMWSLWSLRL